MNKLVNFNGNSYFKKEIEHTSTINSNVTRHGHNKYEHNVIKKVKKHIKHKNIYDTEVNCYNKRSPDKGNYYNFYHDTYNLGKNEIVSSSQQTGITNNITETKNHTTNYIDESY